MAAPPLRWGVMGTGWIVERFVGTARQNTRQQFAAIASRDAARATAAAGRLGVARSHSSYQELAADPEVDVVYVGTGHLDHVPCARIALEHGKHVLVEKPLAPSAAQARELAGLAAARRLFLAEAHWSFFLPRWDVVRQVLADGLLGEVATVSADHGEHFPPEHRILRADQAGGPMLDLGTYPVSFAGWVLDDPAVLHADSRPHPAGVHGQVAAVLGDAAGRLAVLHTSVLGDTPTTASVSGSDATLTLPGPFYQPGDVVVVPAGGGTPLTFTQPRTAHEGLHFEAAEVARRITAGELQTPLRPLAGTLATLRVMDEIRARCGITFPGETRPSAGPSGCGPRGPARPS